MSRGDSGRPRRRRHRRCRRRESPTRVPPHLGVEHRADQRHEATSPTESHRGRRGEQHQDVTHAADERRSRRSRGEVERAEGDHQQPVLPHSTYLLPGEVLALDLKSRRYGTGTPTAKGRPSNWTRAFEIVSSWNTDSSGVRASNQSVPEGTESGQFVTGCRGGCSVSTRQVESR